MGITGCLKSHLSPLCKQLEVDAIAIVPGANFTRLVGVHFHQNERPLMIIVFENGDCAAIVPQLELPAFDLLNLDATIYPWRDQDGYQGAFNRLCEESSFKSLAVEGQAMRFFIVDALLKAQPSLGIIDGEKSISALRLLKNEQEIFYLIRAIEISEKALERTLGEVRIGMSEKDIERILRSELFAEGADDMSFDPIVAASTNSALPHAHARDDYQIKAGDALLMDFGAKYQDLHADITRTFFVAEVNDRLERMYNCVLDANKAGINAATSSASAHDVDDAATKVLENSEFSHLIRHRTGHGLGRLIHEAPEIIRGIHQRLLNGMVFTIEPGLYDEAICGIRIEDDILVENNKARVLTQFDKNLRVLA